MACIVTELTKEDIFVLLHDVLKSKKLLNGEILVEKGSEKGDGYLSVMKKVTITDGNNKLHVIIKCPPSEEIRKALPVTVAFDREIYFYNTLMPAMQKFQADRNVEKPFNNVPHCYLTSVKEFKEYIVMENLRENDYDLFNRQKQLDDSHISILLKAYAKYHAVSFAMQDQDKVLYEKLSKNFTELFKLLPPDLLDQFVRVVDKTITLFNDNPVIQDRLKKFQGKILPLFDSLDRTKWKYEVICHGDCWINNMMFKYQNMKPVDICLIDFQVLRVASPVLDISVCIYASSSHEIYENLDHYLNLYHKYLTNHLRAMGTDIDKVYPLAALKEDWKNYSFFGYIFGPMAIRNLLQEQDKILDFTDLNKNGKTFQEMFQSEGGNSNVIEERIKRLTMHVINAGFI